MPMMQAMRFHQPGQALRLDQIPIPEPGPGEVLVRVSACGVCRTDLHLVDGELPKPKLPIIPGHEIVGVVTALGGGIEGFAPGDRVGIPWLGFTCGICPCCRKGRENLCDHAGFTGYTINGGYAQYTVADARYCFKLPEDGLDAELAPLLCAGLIGYRSYRMAGDDVEKLGIYGFGAAAHIVAQIAAFEGKRVFAFTRPGDEEGKVFARSLGAFWAGDATEVPPEKLDAAIIFAPVGALVPVALQAVDKGGMVVCGGIHMSDIPGFPYRLLWEERVLRSVANLTWDDGDEFLSLAPRVPIRTRVEIFPLEQANEALNRLRRGEVRGAAVLSMPLS